MRCSTILLSALGGWLLAFSAGAQDATNAPATFIESFELQPDTVIVRAFGTVGTVSLGNAALIVRTKESNDVGHSQKTYGIAVEYAENPQPGAFAQKISRVVDYDELEALINGIQSVGSITYDVTSLPSFEASIATKSGLRISAHSDRRQGGIQTFVQFCDYPGYFSAEKIPLNSDQMSQLRNLIVQAKSALDALK